MASKIICFDCQSYSNYNKQGSCYRCNSTLIAVTGAAFRPPKKTNAVAWKELTQLFFLQCSNRKNVINNQETKYFLGFGTNNGYHGMMSTRNVSKKIKMRASLAGIRQAYSYK